MSKKLLVYIVFFLLLLINVLSLEIYTDYVQYQQIAKAAFIVIAAYCVVRSIAKNSSFKRFQLLLLLFYFVLLLTAPFSNHFNQIYSCSFVLLSYFVGFYLSSNNQLNNKNWAFLLIALSCIVILDFYTQISYISMTRGLDVMGGQNVSYKIIGLMIMASVFMKDIRVVLLMCVYFVLVLFCFKKGAVVCGLAILCVVLFFHMLKYKKYRKCTVFLLIIGCCLLINYSGFFFRRFFEYSEQFGHNARDVIYSSILDEWMNGSFSHFLFGRGFFHASDINYFGYQNSYGYYAHSDYYEMLSDYGLIGIIFYVVLLYNAFRTTKKMKIQYWGYAQYPLLVVWLLKAYFSGVYTTFSGFFILLTLGYIHGKDTYEKNHLIPCKKVASEMASANNA